MIVESQSERSVTSRYLIQPVEADDKGEASTSIIEGWIKENARYCLKKSCGLLVDDPKQCDIKFEEIVAIGEQLAVVSHVEDATGALVKAVVDVYREHPVSGLRTTVAHAVFLFACRSMCQ